MTKPTQGLPTVERFEPRRLLAAVADGPEFRVNTYSENAQASPALAMDALGNFVVTWHTTGGFDGSNLGVYAQRYDSTGAAQGGEFRVNTYTTLEQQFPTVAMDVDGDFVVMWESFNQDGSRLGVFGQRYDPFGVARGAEFRVNTYTTADQTRPAVAIDADGDFIAAWSSAQEGQKFYSYGMYAQRYNAQGQQLQPPPGAPVGLGNELHVNTYTTHTQGAATIATDDDGDFVVAWTSHQESPPWNAYGVYAQRFGSDGAARGAEFRVNTYTSLEQSSPAVDMDATGNFVIAWESDGQDGSAYGIYAQRYDSSGAALATEFPVNTYTPANQRYPAVAVDGAGNFIVTWASLDQDGSPGTYGIYARRYSAAGGALAGEFRINSFTPGSQERPVVASAADGDFVVAWNGVGPDDASSIYGQRYAIVPAVTGSSFVYQTGPHRLRFTFDENVSGSLGTDDLAVQNLTTSQHLQPSDFSPGYDEATNAATITYLGTSGVLPDGRYRATLRAAGVHTPNGNTLPADHVFEFRFLIGDANNDGRVNLTDFNILAANFGQSPRDFTQGDFNYDGVVNLLDFNLLAGRFGAALGPATSVADRAPVGMTSRKDIIDELEEMHASPDT